QNTGLTYPSALASVANVGAALGREPLPQRRTLHALGLAVALLLVGRAHRGWARIGRRHAALRRRDILTGAATDARAAALRSPAAALRPRATALAYAHARTRGSAAARCSASCAAARCSASCAAASGVGRVHACLLAVAAATVGLADLTRWTLGRRD